MTHFLRKSCSAVFWAAVITITWWSLGVLYNYMVYQEAVRLAQ